MMPQQWVIVRDEHVRLLRHYSSMEKAIHHAEELSQETGASYVVLGIAKEISRISQS